MRTYGDSNPILRRVRVKRTEQEHLADLDKIAHLYLRGYSFMQIAKEISKERNYTISHTQVAKDIKKIRQMWINNATAAYEEAIGRELAKIDELEKAYWMAYEKATSDKVMKLAEKVVYGGVEKNRGISKTISQNGAGAEFLKGIQWCISKRVELLGLQTGARSLTISWEEEAKRDGISNPEELFESVVKALVEKISDNKLANTEEDSSKIIDGYLVEEVNGQ